MVPKGWRRGTFEEGIELISGQHVEADLVNGKGIGKPYLTGPSDFQNGKIEVSKYTTEGKKFSQKGDLLITVKGSGTGKVIESDNEYAISRQLMAIRPKLFDGRFTLYNLLASISRYEGAAAGLIPGISRNDVLLTPILIPPLPEQKKIAQILSTWDKAITATEQLLANSQQQKKALMQQLLTGKKRFPGFEGAWKSSSLKKLVTISKGQQLNRDTLDESGLFPVINGGVTPSGYTDQGNCKANTITISEGGNSCGYVAFQKNEFWCGGHCYALADLKLPVDYLYQLLKFSESRIVRLRVGSGLPNIQKKDLEALNVAFPVDSNEQMRVAEFLAAADQEVEALQSQLDGLKQEKKALMQQLLTGKCRVKVDNKEG